MTVRIVSLTVVHDDINRVLLVRSARRPSRWELPGGVVEPGESPMAAAKREVLEETGLHVGGLRLVGIYWGRRDSLLRIVFSSSIAEPGPLAPRDESEIQAANWFASDSLPHPMPVIAVQMIDDARSNGEAQLRTVDDDRELV